MTYLDQEHACKAFFETEGEYVGEWSHDMRHGKGEMTWPNGVIYFGYFRHGRRHNVKGTMKFTGGDTYSGHWVNEQMHGTGTWTTSNRVVFTGEFVNGK
jgi:hypothetical protein